MPLSPRIVSATPSAALEQLVPITATIDASAARAVAGRLPAFRGAQLVLGGELDRVVEQRAVRLVEGAVQVVERELDRVHLVLTRASRPRR